MTVDISFRPLVTKWPKPETPARQRRASDWDKHRGVAGWVDHLARELDYMRVRDALVEVDAAPADFKRMGAGLFADARPRTPKVLLTFDKPDAGTLRFACDRYHTWPENLHAIGMTLERMRLIDAYGATTGEQYQGFKALPGAGGTQNGEVEWTPDQAMAVLVERDPTWSDNNIHERVNMTQVGLSNRAFAQVVARNAVKATHPDAGGSAEAFVHVQRARAVLTKHFGEEV